MVRPDDTEQEVAAAALEQAAPVSQAHKPLPSPPHALATGLKNEVDAAQELVASAPPPQQHATEAGIASQQRSPLKTSRSVSISADDYRMQGETKRLYIILAVVLVLCLIPPFVGVWIGIAATAYAAYHIRQQLGHSVQISEKQFPAVHAVVQIAAKNLDMPVPRVFIEQGDQLNAYAAGVGSNKCVVLSSAIVEAMNDDELTAVVGHELSHVKCDHTTWTALTGHAGDLGIPYLSKIFGIVFLSWSRKAEFTCDRGGLIACRNLRASASSLAKLATGRYLFDKLDLEQFVSQRGERNADSLGPIVDLFADHPAIVDRIHALQDFSESDRYKRLIGEEENDNKEPKSHEAVVAEMLKRLHGAGYASHAETAAVNASLKWSPVLAGAMILIAGVVGAANVPLQNTHAGRIAEIEGYFAGLRTHTPIVLYKFHLGSPEILALVDGNTLSDAEILAISVAFNEGLVAASKYAPTNGATIGSLLFLFWAEQKKNRFTESVQERCCVNHFWKRIQLRVSAVDVPNRSVKTRRGSKLLKFLDGRDDPNCAELIFGA
jgi:Zn-dependent protease with chaperone function